MKKTNPLMYLHELQGLATISINIQELTFIFIFNVYRLIETSLVYSLILLQVPLAQTTSCDNYFLFANSTVQFSSKCSDCHEMYSSSTAK